MGEKFSVPPAEIMNVKDESFKLVLLNLKQSVDPLGFNKKKNNNDFDNLLFGCEV